MRCGEVRFDGGWYLDLLMYTGVMRKDGRKDDGMGVVSATPGLGRLAGGGGHY